MCWEEASTVSSTFSWQVEEFRYRHDFWKIRLFFRSNPYFHNQVIVKEYVIHVPSKNRLISWDAREVGESWNGSTPFYILVFMWYISCPSHATTINLYLHYACETYSRRHHASSSNFFNWISDYRFAGSGTITAVGSPRLYQKKL